MMPHTSPSAGSTRTSVSTGLAAFLEGLIDYAGLFPPARLPLVDAISNYAAYRHDADAWMLGRFICPASRLADLRAYTDLFPPHDPFPFSVLGTSAADADQFQHTLQKDLVATHTFLEEHDGRATADVLEVRLPEDVAEGAPASVTALVEPLVQAVQDLGLRFDSIYLEVPFVGDWRRTFRDIAAILARPPAGQRFGLKVRCGGLTPDAFPTPEQLAFVLVCARDDRIPFKATAGLHHPVRHHDRSLEVMQHGFLNVFGAGILAHALELTEPALRQVLRSEQIKAFTFDDAGFAFQDLRITNEQLVRARRNFAHSFGSCSFDEPRADLRAAGIL